MVRKAMTNVKTTRRLAFVAAVILSAPLCQATDPKPDYYCEYIANSTQTSGAWIDSGVLATPYTALSLDMEFTAYQAAQLAPFGYKNASSLYHNNFMMYLVNGATLPDGKIVRWLYYRCFNSYKQTSFNVYPTNINVRMTITMDAYNKALSISTNAPNGTLMSAYSTNMSITPDTEAAYSEYPIAIFNERNMDGNTAGGTPIGRIYGCTIATNGVQVRNFKPAVSGGVAGLWDEVECRFYASASEKAFTAGPKLKLGGMRIIFR